MAADGLGKSWLKSKEAFASGKAITPRTLVICVFAVVVGVVSGLIAQGLLQLIYLFTNVFFAGRWSFKVVYPDQFHLGPWVVLIPPIGGFIAGLMIHYWEPTLKGHGTPQAMEAVLIGHSMLRRRVGILKPLATALTIGTGGPFGAEGPIIQTGSVFGSILGQVLRLTPYERRVLLAGGAAAGLAATFIAPLSGILLCIELLLFEFSARSFIPVGLASAAGTAVAVLIRGDKPLFGARPWALAHMGEIWLFVPLGVLMGLLSVALIGIMFWIEDIFDRFPLKPASIWAPTAGGFIMGAIGYFFPHAFGTSYDTIGAILNDRFHVAKSLEVSGAKFWALIFSLGSGTTGGVFAPSLVIGGGFGSAFGALCHHFLPSFAADPSAYALVAMGALFAGIARAPLTSIAFMVELSRNVHAIIPLVVACFIADLLCRLLSVDSIMTGKLHKRGLLIFQDYSAPVLIGSHIGDVVERREPLSTSLTLSEAAEKASRLNADTFSVVNAQGELTGVVEAHDLLHEHRDRALTVGDVVREDYVLVEPGEHVQDVAEKMLFGRVEHAVVVEAMDRPVPLGVVRATDLLRLQRRLREKHLLLP
ncbi:MAG: chloride channel protein [Terriglobia bacterium]